MLVPKSVFILMSFLEREGREWGVGSVIVGSALGRPDVRSKSRAETWGDPNADPTTTDPTPHLKKREGVPEMDTEPLKALRGYRASNQGSKGQASKGSIEKHQRL